MLDGSSAGKNEMVPSRGLISNPGAPVLAEQNEKHKTEDSAQESCSAIDVEQLFNTLAEWNDYLENHVPYYLKPQEPGL